eukprot:SAG22_NODE_10920_length_509_cov_2.614634_1_plen_84_part_00
MSRSRTTVKKKARPDRDLVRAVPAPFRANFCGFKLVDAQFQRSYLGGLSSSTARQTGRICCVSAKAPLMNARTSFAANIPAIV